MPRVLLPIASVPPGRSVRLSPITEEATTTFVGSWLDCCNSLLYGVNDRLLNKLQIVHNASARVVTITARKFDHISLVPCELHWLPVCYRIAYKLATIVVTTAWTGASISGRRLRACHISTVAGLAHPVIVNS